MIGVKRGTQILSVPSHAEGNLDHPEVQAGFVTSVRGEHVYCRYWRKDLSELRTKANSECTPIYVLYAVDTVPQARVEAALIEIEEGTLL